MIIKSFDMWLYKSDRKNSKREWRSWKCFPDSKGGKKELTIYDVREVIQWIILNKDYKHYSIGIYEYNTKTLGRRICRSEKKKYYSIEGIINEVYNYMRLLNFKEFDMTLGELHSESNMRYTINQYYHGGNQ